MLAGFKKNLAFSPQLKCSNLDVLSMENDALVLTVRSTIYKKKNFSSEKINTAPFIKNFSSEKNNTAPYKKLR